MSLLNKEQIEENLQGSNNWFISEKVIKKKLKFNSYMDSIKFINEVAVKAEEYADAGTVISSTCAGTTLLVTKADGQGGTYTDPQLNSTQCGYVAPPSDPCYNGSWYIGFGNPLCEDVDSGYKKYCPNGVVSTGNYVLTTPENCR